MKAFHLSNTSDVSFSASPASAGGHEALSNVPGSALWGVSAGARYRDGGKHFGPVHSGDLRISPGFPLVDGEAAFPIPQTLRRPKHAEPAGGDGWLPEATWNTVWPVAKDQGAGEAFKRQFLTASGRLVRPRVAERGKTAIAEGGRRAADGQYFQYEHLEAGQDWVFWMEGSAEEASEAILTKGPLRLGRSRLPEYGGAFHARPLSGWSDPRAGQWREKAADLLVLWCLSDLACIDSWGSPALAPSLQDLGIGPVQGELDVGRSAILTRRYAPWNNFLRAPDREHSVIEAGSVLVYRLSGEIDLTLFRDGCGRWRERGLGLVWPNPPLLMEPRPAKGLSRIAVAPDYAASSVSEISSPLSLDEARVVSVLKSRLGSRQAEAQTDAEAGRLTKVLLAALKAAADRGEETPGPSQWSLVAIAAEASPDLGTLRRSLLATGGICVGAANPDWQSVVSVVDHILGQPTVTADAIARAAWRLRGQWNGAPQ